MNDQLLHLGLKDTEMKGHGKKRYKGVEQHTFLTPEATRLLKEYLRYRRARGEVLTSDSPLFATEDKPYRAMHKQTVIAVFRRASRNSGIAFSPHDMRRFGQTAFEEARLNPNYIRKLLGHKVKGEEAPYSRPNVDKLREAYKTALPQLCFMDRTPQLTETEVLKQSVIRQARLLYKDDPERLGKFENLLKRAVSVKEIDEALENA